jgi:hypothetical protein
MCITGCLQAPDDCTWFGFEHIVLVHGRLSAESRPASSYEFTAAARRPATLTRGSQRRAMGRAEHGQP